MLRVSKPLIKHSLHHFSDLLLSSSVLAMVLNLLFAQLNLLIAGQFMFHEQSVVDLLAFEKLWAFPSLFVSKLSRIL